MLLLRFWNILGGLVKRICCLPLSYPWLIEGGHWNHQCFLCISYSRPPNSMHKNSINRARKFSSIGSRYVPMIMETYTNNRLYALSLYSLYFSSISSNLSLFSSLFSFSFVGFNNSHLETALPFLFLYLFPILSYLVSCDNSVTIGIDGDCDAVDLTVPIFSVPGDSATRILNFLETKSDGVFLR